MYYIALVNRNGDILYPEHYEEEVGRARRKYSYTTQACNEVGEWVVYEGDEPFECLIARGSIIRGEDEPLEELEARVATAVQNALDTTSSVLKPTMIDDEPEWHKMGYQTLEEYEAHNPKAKMG